MSTSVSAIRRDGSQSPIWAMTAYFNPLGYRRRLWNYHLFRKRLSVPLLTVEFGRRGKFDLSPDDADLLIQVDGPDVLWQRERLFNVGLSRVPEDVTKVVWLDCDVLFENQDWVTNLDRALDKLPLVQAYSEIVLLPKQESPTWNAEFNRLDGRPSVCSLLSARDDLERVCRHLPRDPGRVFPGPSGAGWAFRKELMLDHSFYDACVLGGGDIQFVAALAGCFDIATGYHAMGAAARQHYLGWAERFHREVDQQVGCSSARMYHLWHGDVSNRGYQTRYDNFERFDFDPEADLATTDGGAWKWGSDKPDLHQFVQEYFSSRREDG